VKADFDCKTLRQFLNCVRYERKCVAFFTQIRFANGAYCPHCGHRTVYLFADARRYRCAKCKHDFTAKTKTVLGESKLPLRKWFIAIYLLTRRNRGISSCQLAEKVGVTYKTAEFMHHRIHAALNKVSVIRSTKANEIAPTPVAQDKKESIQRAPKGRKGGTQTSRGCAPKLHYPPPPEKFPCQSLTA
jgi:transposase-like protein